MVDKAGPKKASGKSKKSDIVESEQLRAARAALGPFLKLNRHSQIEEGGSKSRFRYVDAPWGDRSIGLLISYDDLAADQPLIDALNNLFLPERLTALYHKDTRTIEVIWTAYKLPAEDSDLVNRRFSFRYQNNEIKCEFSKSTDRLLAIANRAMYVTVSDSGFRNLQSFTSLLRKSETDTRHGEPLSFYIKGVDWKEEETLQMIRHLNFYLRYYDLRSPHVLIHPSKDHTVIKEKGRYVEGSFPEVITSRKLDQTLLQFWIAAYDQDVPTRFLLYYRILEYVASYHLQEDQKAAFKRTLSTPHLLNDVDKTIDILSGIIREDARNDLGRFVKTFEELVDTDRIWKEICLNPEAFTKDTALDGGFNMKALVANTKSKDAFGPRGMEALARQLRDIRNGLAHGGQAQGGRLILPTSRNFKKLLPWVHLIATAAGEVVLYEHLA